MSCARELAPSIATRRDRIFIGTDDFFASAIGFDGDAVHFFARQDKAEYVIVFVAANGLYTFAVRAQDVDFSDGEEQREGLVGDH